MSPLHNQDFTLYNSLDILQEIDALKAQIDELRPLSKELEDKIFQKFRLDWNYNSNAIEGNSLDFGETAAFLMHGITAKGKPLKDYLDIRGHNEAIDYLTHLVRHREELTEMDIRSIHKMLLVEPYVNFSQDGEGKQIPRRINIGEYKRMPNHVKTVTGEIHYYASPEETPILMEELVNWYRDATSSRYPHPLIISAIFHHRLTSIHPFDDGNGRMSRLMMNLILMQHGFPPVVIKDVNKNEYYLFLSQADTGDLIPFIKFIGANLITSLNLYIKGARGESLEEPSDLKKKLGLFKKEIAARRDRLESKRSIEVQKTIFANSITELLNSLQVNLADFKDLFLNYLEGSVKPKDSRSGWIFSKNNLIEYGNSEFSKELSGISQILFNFRLEDFKLEDNVFSVDIVVLIQLEEYKYTVFFGILDATILRQLPVKYLAQWINSSFSVSKYYHQQLSPDEISNFVSIISNLLLDFIKFQVNDSVLYEYPNDEDIRDKFVEILKSLALLPDETINDLRSSIRVVSDERYIRIMILSDLYNILPADGIANIERRIYLGLNNQGYVKFDKFISIVEI